MTCTGNRWFFPGLVLQFFINAALAMSMNAATVTLTTNVAGPTPVILGYNSGHFFTNSNTKDWWRYAGVNGARIFLSPSEIEPSDDIPENGDGVTDQASFLSRKSALRSDPLNLSYINWAGATVFSNRWENNDLYPNNHIKPNYALRELRRLGVQICAQLTASQSRFPISGTNDWPNMWELWQHYYAQAFYLARVFDVERFQMFNEPNHSNANGLTITNHLLRLQLVADAVHSALADVNVRYGRSLKPTMLAPVTSGSADGSYAGWGASVVTNRHLNFLGQTLPGVSLLQVYDYHQYGSSPAGFGSDLANLHSLLTAAMAPETRVPTAISEFNTDTGAEFDKQLETLDTPSKYSRFGAILVNLLHHGCSELYCFKFSQTERDAPTTYPVAKNAMHYVDNVNAPYNVGGITKAGEVYRLLIKGFRPGRSRVLVDKSPQAAALDVLGSYDPNRRCYYFFSVNNTTAGLAVDLDVTGLPVPTGNRVQVEEVSEARYAGVSQWTTVPPGGVLALGVQPANSVWLVSLPAGAQTPEQLILASGDGEVRDGANVNVNYATAPRMVVRNDPANSSNRSVALMQFNLAGIDRGGVQHALLSLQASSVSTNTTAQAHVYGLTSTNWDPATVTWGTAPSLLQNVKAGNTIAAQCVSGRGDTAFILGQMVVRSTNAAEIMIDVTEWVRTSTDSVLSFLIAQDPRWDIALPSLAAGDTQPDGLSIVTQEGGAPPRLRLVTRPAATNMPPQPRSDAASTLQAVPVPIHPLENDSDPEGDTLSIAAISRPSHGSVSHDGLGTLTYAPDPGFAGLDQFAYWASDGAGSNSAQISVTVEPAGTPYWTNVPARLEAVIRGGASAGADQDEVATGYLMVKYNSPSLDFARKTYFQFDLTGLAINGSSQAVFTVGFLNPYRQNVQLWGLNQAYPAFSPVLTWNAAQANDLSGNGLLAAGQFSAARIGVVTNVPASGTAPVSWLIPRAADFLRAGAVTLALTGEPDVAGFTNNASGLRLLRTNATLRVLVVPALPPGPVQPPVFSGFDPSPTGGLKMSFFGSSNRTHWLQANTNVVGGTWLTLSTNLSDADGTWTATDFLWTNFARRFYRAVVP